VTVQADFWSSKRQSDLRMLTEGANSADAVRAISSTSYRPKERLLSKFGWGWLLAAGAAILVVTWFAIHLPV
jgi:fructoselysine-6-P-deglycase FrlB-like protein